ncbi:DUF6531 domain-containing protein [Paraburkholderia strydomiana]|uniref:DUF6531 domain-containing protein n=1 Tax=Paraburkholderia strydomiana TaxID=1245417 RepID=UPI002857B7B1|nr:DUF6531 domain-containing protein [Paraburkholderia strydomiana]MDR7009271.1 YD repeat-containing protein [Paraburkholderia strydomiana]
MKRRRRLGVATVFARRLFPAFTLFLSINANAADCSSLYAQSGATPGSPTCKLDVTSNSPTGMGNYACINDLVQIEQWCNTPADPPADGTCSVADPVFPANGIVTLSETDFASGDASPLVFARSYLSKPFDKAQSAMGGYWVSNWQRRLDLTAVNASAPKITAYQSSGQPLIFRPSGGAWTVPGTSGVSLTKSSDGYYYLKDERLGTTETYFFDTGRLHSETTRMGFYREVIYDGQRIDAIAQWPVDRVGQTPSRLTLSLTYDSSGRVVSVVPPSGNATHYAYDTKGNLTSVTAPIGYVRQYLYEDARFPNALSGIKDESGSRIATWSYDSKGRTISVTHPDTTRNVSLAYGSGTTTVGNSTGNTIYSFIVGDASRPASIATPGGTVSRTWDTSGNLKQKTTPDGNTQYTWDAVNRPTKATAIVDDIKTVTTVEYSDGNSLRPHLVATPGKLRAFVYDTAGNVTGYAEWQTTDQTGEQGLHAVAAGDQMTVGARYDAAGRMLSATVVRNGATTEDWTYTYDVRGNIATTIDAVSGWAMRTLSRNSENRATQIAGNSGQASVAYDERGRVKNFQYNEPASTINGGRARVLTVDYQYAASGTVSSRSAKVSTNGGWWQPISDTELGAWLANWELGNDPVAPPANLSGVKSDDQAFVPDMCVECYVSWKAKLTGRLYQNEVSEALPKWGETTELMLAAQSQLPVIYLIPELAASSKRSMIYTDSVSSAKSLDNGFVKCGGSGDNEWREADCHAKYERDVFKCNTFAKYMGGLPGLALCKKQAFDDYQECRGH